MVVREVIYCSNALLPNACKYYRWFGNGSVLDILCEPFFFYLMDFFKVIETFFFHRDTMEIGSVKSHRHYIGIILIFQFQWLFQRQYFEPDSGQSFVT